MKRINGFIVELWKMRKNEMRKNEMRKNEMRKNEMRKNEMRTTTRKIISIYNKNQMFLEEIVKSFGQAFSKACGGLGASPQQTSTTHLDDSKTTSGQVVQK